MLQQLIDMSGDYITFDIGEKKDQRIKIVGTYDHPYFCGKDVCEILEYSNDQKALFYNVEQEFKKDLKTLSEEVHPPGLDLIRCREPQEFNLQSREICLH